MKIHLLKTYALASVMFVNFFTKAQTWSPIFVPGTVTGTTTIGNSSLDDYDFGDDNNGMVSVGYAYHITTDGGATWSHWKDFSPYPQMKGIDYTSPSTVFTGCGNGRIYKSTDNGNTFMEKGYPAGNINAIEFNNNFGVVVDQTCKAGYSNDGGETWTAISHTVLCNNLSAMRYISVPDQNTAYIGGSNNNLFKTTNGGATWSSIITGFSGNYTGISFLNASLGYVTVYASGSPNTAKLFKTTDGGSTWTDLTANVAAAGSSTTSTFGGVIAIDNNILYLGTNSGRLLVSFDGGVTFNLDFTNPACSSCVFTKFKKAGNYIYMGVGNGGSHPKVYRKLNTAISVKELEVPTMHFSAAPNPANESIQIQGVDFNTGIHIKIISLEGKVLKDETTQQSIVNISDLSTGMYFIELTDATGKTGTKKIIKE